MSSFGSLREGDLVSEPAPAIRFVAVCEDCDWTGRQRIANLAALGDFDAHVASATHREVVQELAVAKVDPDDFDDNDAYQAALIDARHDAYHGGASGS